MKKNTREVIGDERGQLVVLEGGKDIPFEISRVFYIYNTERDRPRGMHAHFRTKQYIVAVNGSCRISLDDGFKETEIELSRPEEGVFQDSLVWGSMYEFSEDCVLLVLASHPYDESDYIRDYESFKRVIAK